MKVKIMVCTVLVMALLLCACGKAAPEQQQVKQLLPGEWVKVAGCLDGIPDDPLVFTSNGRVTDLGTGEKGRWTSDGWYVTFPEKGETVTRTLTPCSGAWTLGRNPGSYVRLKDVEKLFVWVELTEENADDYLELVDMPYVKDGVSGSALWLKSKAYDRGLCYVLSSGLKIQVHTPEGTLENTLVPFGAVGDSIHQLHAADCTLGSVEGTLLFAREKNGYGGWEINGNQRMVRILGEDIYQNWPCGGCELPESAFY